MEPGKSWHTKDYFSSWIEPQNEGPSSSAPVSGSAPATPVAVASPSSAEKKGARSLRDEAPAQRSKIPPQGSLNMSVTPRVAEAAKAPHASPGMAAGFLTRKDHTRSTGAKFMGQGRPAPATSVGAETVGVLPSSDQTPSTSAAGLTSEPAVGLNAAEEKERGNDMYRKGRYEEAVRCYSHSLALDPSAVAFANRAMAFLKLTRYEEAERDCSQALERDDEYVKALSRRATARLRLKRPLEALQDIEAALTLEPGSKDLVSLREQAEKAIASTPRVRPLKASPAKQAEESPAERRVPVVEHKPGASVSSTGGAETETAVPPAPEGASCEAAPGREAASAATEPQDPQPHLPVARDSLAGMAGRGESLEVLGGRAGSGVGASSGTKSTGALEEARAPESSLVARSMKLLWQQRLEQGTPGSGLKPPQSAYEFEAAWRSLGSMQEEQGPGGKQSQGGLPLDAATSTERGAKLAYLQTLDASSLPTLLKDSLSGPLLLDILSTVLVPLSLRKGGDFRSWALTFLENLQRTPRFGIASLCLTAPMRAELAASWAAAGGLEALKDLSTSQRESLAALAKTLRVDTSVVVPGCKQGS